MLIANWLVSLTSSISQDWTKAKFWGYNRPLAWLNNAEFARQFFARQGGNDDAHVERALGVADAELRKIDRKVGVGQSCKRSKDEIYNRRSIL